MLGATFVAGQLIPVTIDNCDLNRDLVVSFPDFTAVSGSYGSTNIIYDLNHNGLVDFPDFLTFIEHWGGLAPG